MAYVVKLGEPRPAPARERTSWASGLEHRRGVLAALLAAALVSTGVLAYQVIPRSPIVATEDPNSAQEVADDGGGSNRIAANGEVADDSDSSRSLQSR